MALAVKEADVRAGGIFSIEERQVSNCQIAAPQRAPERHRCCPTFRL